MYILSLAPPSGSTRKKDDVNRWECWVKILRQLAVTVTQRSVMLGECNVTSTACCQNILAFFLHSIQQKCCLMLCCCRPSMICLEHKMYFILIFWLSLHFSDYTFRIIRREQLEQRYIAFWMLFKWELQTFSARKEQMGSTVWRNILFTLLLLIKIIQKCLWLCYSDIRMHANCWTKLFQVSKQLSNFS